MSEIKVSDLESNTDTIGTAQAHKSVSNRHKMITLDRIDCSAQVSERNKRRRRSQMLVVDSEAMVKNDRRRAKSDRRSGVASEDMEDLIS